MIKMSNTIRMSSPDTTRRQHCLSLTVLIVAAVALLFSQSTSSSAAEAFSSITPRRGSTSFSSSRSRRRDSFFPLARGGTSSTSERQFLPSTKKDNVNNEQQSSIILHNSRNYDDESGTGEVNNIKKGGSQRSFVAGLFLSVLTALGIGAKAGILRGPPMVGNPGGEVLFGQYTDTMIVQDVGATILCASLGYVLVKIIQLGYDKQIYNNKVSRKLSHILSAPLFILFFPIFSDADGARFFAASVASVNAVRLYLAGTGEDENLANTISRSGDKSEVLQGPFIYVCLFQLFIVLFWRTSMVGVIAMSTMAAGDGMADIVGRKFGSTNKWWFSDSKSIAGSLAFVVASAVTCVFLVAWLGHWGCLHYTMENMELGLRIVAISTICSIIELFPFIDDNYSVPISAAALTALLLH